MINRKKISIIVPCYNTERYIEECLESIVNQTIGIENIQLIIIDDASTDNSLEYILKYANKYPDSVLVEILKENCGQANARNIGIDLAETPYLVFVDSDDWISLDFCEKMLPSKDEDYDFIQCGYIMWKEWEDRIIQMEKPLITKIYREMVQLSTPEQKKAFYKDNNVFHVIMCCNYALSFLI